VATYLLAPGFFHNLVRRQSAGRPVTPPLAPDPRLATLALHRYEQTRAASRLSALSSCA
jgi:hypothetical protein